MKKLSDSHGSFLAGSLIMARVFTRGVADPPEIFLRGKRLLRLSALMPALMAAFHFSFQNPVPMTH